MGVAKWFETFNKNLRMDDETVDAIRYRYHEITKRLNKDFWNTESETSHSLYVGSYGRDTEIFTSDIDMLFRLPYDVYDQYNRYLYNGQSALLQAVKNSIKNRYPRTDLGGDGQVVVVEFGDNIKFEVLPAFVNKDNSFTYPDSNNGGSWSVTNPRPEIEAIKDMNAQCNYNLKPLCRMIRAWKQENNVSMSGILIDTLAYKFIKDYEYKDKSYLYYDWMCRDFFKYLADMDEDQEYWLAPGSNRRVYRYAKFQYKAKQAYNNALSSIKDESQNLSYSATTTWRKIFGYKFPIEY